MTKDIAPTKLIYGVNLGEMLKHVGEGGTLPWFEHLMTKHALGDCGDAWTEEDFVLLQLRNQLRGLPFESRWRTDIGIMVLCTFFDGEVLAAEMLQYPPAQSASS